jgi:glutamate decarboxylase
LPCRISTKIALANEEKEAAANKEKRDLEKTREITTVWRKFVMQRKMNGVC